MNSKILSRPLAALYSLKNTFCKGYFLLRNLYSSSTHRKSIKRRLTLHISQKMTHLENNSFWIRTTLKAHFSVYRKYGDRQAQFQNRDCGSYAEGTIRVQGKKYQEEACGYRCLRRGSQGGPAEKKETAEGADLGWEQASCHVASHLQVRSRQSSL